MDRTPLKSLRVLAALSPASVLVLIALGGYVRASGASLACPDWPFCPEITSPLILLEFVHRAWTLVVMGLVVAVAVLSWRVRRSFKGSVMLGSIALYAMLTLTLLIIQVFIGAATVLLELPPVLSMLHLIVATLIFAFSLVTALVANQLAKSLVMTGVDGES